MQEWPRRATPRTTHGMRSAAPGSPPSARSSPGWRTALTSIAVAVGVGRVVPELSGTSTEWPYLVVGIGWALYSVALFGYGSVRSRKVERALDTGEMIPSSRTEARLLMGSGILLCLATVGLIAASA